MVMQRNKGVLEANLFTKNNQKLVVQGMPAPLVVISRDAIPMSMGVIETADKRRMPGGRNNAGEFSMVVQLAMDEMRDAFLTWYSLCQDRGNGVSPNYKRDGTLTYDRLFLGSPATEFSGAGRAGRPFKLRLTGLWISQMEFPEFSMADGDEGDADAHVTCTMSFDDVEPDEGFLNRAIQGLTGRR